MNLTAASRRALQFARDQAEAEGATCAGTGHLVIAVLAEHDGVAARVLRSLGFRRGDLNTRLRRLPQTLEEPASGASWLSRPAKMAVECALQEALILGQRDAGTEHLLLGLLRTPHPFPDTSFARLVGFEDRLRIRNQTLRLVARPPTAREVAQRRERSHMEPQSGFEAYALRTILDHLKAMPEPHRVAVNRLTLQLVFEQGDRSQPQIQVHWNVPEKPEGAGPPATYRTRIPPAGAYGPRDLRRSWVDQVLASPRVTRQNALAEPGAELEPALLLLGRRLAEHLCRSDEFSEALGRGIPIAVSPPARRHPSAPRESK